ncbi:hypothetical protein KY360_06615 [Candidatus Woesearchaeota archaeon]|nr:hypothetical protein [Candidatus Woesearchaeota archaeon]
MEKKRILIMMMEVGNGHKIPALAIESYIQRTYPNEYDIKVIDFAKDLGNGLLDKFCKYGWKFCLKHPAFFSLLYRLFDIRHAKYVSRFFGRKLISKVGGLIKDFEPSLILSTHLFSSDYLAFLKNKGKIDVPCVSINIEPFDSHYFWIHPELDTIVFSEKAKRDFIKRGVSESKIKIFDYCLRPDFSFNLPSKKDLRKKLGLDSEKLTLLLAAGGEGIGNIQHVLKDIIKKNLDVQVLAVTGRNKGLHKKLKKMKANNQNISVFGYVHNMEELMKASDLICGKSGPNFTFEALALKRPIIYTYSMMNERPTRDFIVKNKLGWHFSRHRDLTAFVQKILEDKSKLNMVENNIQLFDFKCGTQEVSEYLLSLMK